MREWLIACGVGAVAWVAWMFWVIRRDRIRDHGRNRSGNA